MKIISTILLISFGVLNVFSQNLSNSESIIGTSSNENFKFSIYTTWLSLSNFGKPETNTHHYEIHAAYQLTKKDRIGI